MIYYSAVGQETKRRIVGDTPDDVIGKINEFHTVPYEPWDIFEEMNNL
jgi:hypothetical protein